MQFILTMLQIYFSILELWGYKLMSESRDKSLPSNDEDTVLHWNFFIWPLFSARCSSHWRLASCFLNSPIFYIAAARPRRREIIFKPHSFAEQTESQFFACFLYPIKRQSEMSQGLIKTKVHWLLQRTPYSVSYTHLFIEGASFF